MWFIVCLNVFELVLFLCSSICSSLLLVCSCLMKVFIDSWIMLCLDEVVCWCVLLMMVCSDCLVRLIRVMVSLFMLWNWW